MDKEKKNLLSLIDNFAQKKIAIWGDFILDEYIIGTTRRISREAPVLIPGQVRFGVRMAQLYEAYGRGRDRGKAGQQSRNE